MQNLFLDNEKILETARSRDKAWKDQISADLVKLHSLVNKVLNREIDVLGKTFSLPHVLTDDGETYDFVSLIPNSLRGEEEELTFLSNGHLAVELRSLLVDVSELIQELNN